MSYAPQPIRPETAVIKLVKNIRHRRELSAAKWPWGNTYDQDIMNAQRDELENRLHKINSLTRQVNSMFDLYLDANDGHVYLRHWSRDCDCVESTSIHHFEPVDEDGNRRSATQMAELIDELIDRENEWADGPFSIGLINKSAYDELKANPIPKRDRIAEAWDNGNTAPYNV